MREIERIVGSGLIDKDFLKEEVKSGFLVTTKRKELFAVLLDMMYKFDAVCRKHNLTYYLMYGSLLGAVRHHGFVPWDDDIDVAMPRKDYEKFIRLKEEFSKPLFLQTPYTDPGYFYTPARIRNSNTCAVVKMFEYAGFNQGIWLSIFPLDYWDDNGGEERYEEIRKLVLHNSTYMRIGNPNLGEKDLARVEAWKMLKRNPIYDYEEIQRIASSCKNVDSKHVIVAVTTQGNYSKKLLNASDFEYTVSLDFEGFSFLAPCGYEHLLKVWYDDYMQLPPMEERGIWHEGAVFDADISYKEYLEKRGIFV